MSDEKIDFEYKKKKRQEKMSDGDLKDAWKSYDTCPLCGIILRNYVDIERHSHITDVNPEFLKILGVDIEEMLK